MYYSYFLLLLILLTKPRILKALQYTNSIWIPRLSELLSLKPRTVTELSAWKISKHKRWYELIIGERFRVEVINLHLNKFRFKSKTTNYSAKWSTSNWRFRPSSDRTYTQIKFHIIISKTVITGFKKLVP